MTDKKEALKKSLAVLNITLGEEEPKIDSEAIISHVTKVQKSLSTTMQEFDARLDELLGKGGDSTESAEVIKKSFGDLQGALDSKFEAVGGIMKALYEDSVQKSESIGDVMETMATVAEAMAEVKGTLEGMSEASLRGRAYTAQGFVQKSFTAGDEGDPDMKGVKQVPVNNKAAVLALFDEAEQILKKSSNAVGVEQLSEMAAMYEASGVLEPEMHEVLSRETKAVFI